MLLHGPYLQPIVSVQCVVQKRYRKRVNHIRQIATISVVLCGLTSFKCDCAKFTVCKIQKKSRSTRKIHKPYHAFLPFIIHLIFPYQRVLPIIINYSSSDASLFQPASTVLTDSNRRSCNNNNKPKICGNTNPFDGFAFFLAITALYECVCVFVALKNNKPWDLWKKKHSSNWLQTFTINWII